MVEQEMPFLYTARLMRCEMTFPDVGADVGRRQAVLDVIAVAGAVMLGAWARIPLPFSPVPATLQTLPVLLAAFAVGRFRATAGVLLYVGLGLAGVPLFATAFGPTFGYLLAFVAVPSVVTRFRHPAVGMVAGTAVIYGSGALWLSLWLSCTAGQAIVMGVLPFLPGDLLKLLVAYRLAKWMRG